MNEISESRVVNHLRSLIDRVENSGSIEDLEQCVLGIETTEALHGDKGYLEVLSNFEALIEFGSKGLDQIETLNQKANSLASDWGEQIEAAISTWENKIDELSEEQTTLMIENGKALMNEASQRVRERAAAIDGPVSDSLDDLNQSINNCREPFLQNVRVLKRELDEGQDKVVKICGSVTAGADTVSTVMVDVKSKVQNVSSSLVQDNLTNPRKELTKARDEIVDEIEEFIDETLIEKIEETIEFVEQTISEEIVSLVEDGVELLGEELRNGLEKMILDSEAGNESNEGVSDSLGANEPVTEVMQAELERVKGLAEQVGISL